MLTTKKDKLRRWRNYYQALLYVDDFDLDVDANTPPPGRAEVKTPNEEPLLTLAEVQAAIARLKNRKASGADGITPEMVKSGGPFFQKKLHELITKVWDSDTVMEAQCCSQRLEHH